MTDPIMAAAPDGSDLAIVLNPAAGRAVAEREAITHWLAAHAPQARLIVLPPGGDAGAAAAEAVASGTRRVVAAGGDGTLRAVATALLEREPGVAFGVLPIGTRNHFARDLGVPIDLAGALAVLEADVRRQVDVGEVNGRVFLNNASLGLYPRAVARRRRLRRAGWRHWPAFAEGLLTAWQQRAPLEVRLQAPGHERAGVVPFLLVANNAYDAGGLRLARRDRLDAGLLALYWPEGSSPAALLQFALRGLFGHLRPDETPERLDLASFGLALASKALVVALDGELVRIETPLHFRSRPAALTVIAPATAPTASAP